MSLKYSDPVRWARIVVQQKITRRIRFETDPEYREHCKRSETCKKKIGNANRGRIRGPLTKEHKQKISKSKSGRECTWLKNKTYEEIYGPEKAAQLKAAKSKRFQGDGNPAKRSDVRVKISKSNTGKVRSQEDSENKRLCMLRHWADPIKARKHFEALRRKPTSIEVQLQALLDKHFPGEWKYVGDGYTWIAGKNPDFLNVNCQKTLIEIFGSYWHKPEDEQIRIDHFSKYGFRTLVIWDYELDDLEKVVQHIQEFSEKE